VLIVGVGESVMFRVVLVAELSAFGGAARSGVLATGRGVHAVSRVIAMTVANFKMGVITGRKE
jgi:hypothetical protein